MMIMEEKERGIWRDGKRNTLGEEWEEGKGAQRPRRLES
jgi:hypothetical protein